jgi:hypothetical protein
MDSENNQKQLDADIQKCREDILRRRKSIIPPFGQPPKREPVPSTDTNKNPASPLDNPAPPEEPTHKEAVPEMTDAVTEDISAHEATDDLYSKIEQIATETNQAELRIEEPTENFAVEMLAGDGQIEDIIADENPSEQLFDDGQSILESGGEADTALETEESEFLTDIEDNEKMASAEIQAQDSQDMEIPRFDLAEQIMAEHRKLAQNRRKGPGSQRIPIIEEEPKPNRPSQKIAEAPMSPQQRLIAEIVAKDIHKFYSVSAQSH